MNYVNFLLRAAEVGRGSFVFRDLSIEHHGDEVNLAHVASC
jgi:hypothetical protein